jgi:hypothetical protein
MGYDAEEAAYLSRLAEREASDYWEEKVAAVPHPYPVDDVHSKIPERKSSMSRKDALKRKSEALDRQRRALEEELTRLENRPGEPPDYSKTRPAIITFSKQFGQFAFDKYTYSYAFIRAAGKWYGTGPKAPKGYTWDELMDWLEDTGPMPEIHVVTETALWHPRNEQYLEEEG